MDGTVYQMPTDEHQASLVRINRRPEIHTHESFS